jgi:hypothetical protein
MSQHLFRLKVPRLCNESVEGYLDRAEKAAMMAQAAQKLGELFDVLHIYHKNDHNMRRAGWRKCSSKRFCMDATVRRR